MAEAVAFNVDHFIYKSWKHGKCSRCDERYGPGDRIRVAGDLDDNGFWHEECPVADKN